MTDIYDKINAKLFILFEYFEDVPPMNKFKLRVSNLFWMLLVLMFGETGFYVLIVGEILNFIIWYYKNRNGELYEKRKQKEKELLGNA